MTIPETVWSFAAALALSGLFFSGWSMVVRWQQLSRRAKRLFRNYWLVLLVVAIGCVENADSDNPLGIRGWVLPAVLLNLVVGVLYHPDGDEDQPQVPPNH